ncbi:MAG: hypothetical protein [Sanya fiers-like virus 36]|nr:MAG: hypothetical protein [Sanya fiers-like virus 36]
MSNIANITVYDGAATPVAHTLVAESVTRQGQRITAKWSEKLAGVPEYAQVRVMASLEKMPSGTYKAYERVEIPVMESISGQNAAGYTAAPKVAYVDRTDIIGYYSERSIVAGRRSSRQLAINLAGNVSTSVTPATAGPIPELFDLLVAPT